MIDYDSFEEFRDPQTYDLVDNGYDDDWPLTEQWARSLGGPLLDLACGTGLYAFDAATGLWSAGGLAPGYPLGPAIYEKYVVIGSGSTLNIYSL